MRTLFDTGSLQAGGSAPLLMELGTNYCLVAKIHPESQQPLFARLWAFEASKFQESLETIGASLKEAGISEETTHVAVSFPEAVVLPETFNGDKNVILNALFPGSLGSPHHFIKEHRFAFLIPFTATEALNKYFRRVNYIPAFACLPPAEAEGNSIHAYFIDSHFRVAVYKGQELQLTQQYSFTTPLDVVYYLLKICTEFGLSQQHTLLSVSGFITASSALYKELHQYFLNIRFALLDTIEIEGQAVPKHYFSSLYNLAACAS